MSIHEFKTPQSVTHDNGDQVTYYPAAARVQGQHKGTGFYPVTCGGIVIGGVQKHEGRWIALVELEDGNRVELDDDFTSRNQAVAHVGTTKVAARAYREAGREGAWGHEVQQRILLEDALKEEQAADYSQQPAPTTREDVAENPADYHRCTGWGLHPYDCEQQLDADGEPENLIQTIQREKQDVKLAEALREAETAAAAVRRAYQALLATNKTALRHRAVLLGIQADRLASDLRR